MNSSSSVKIHGVPCRDACQRVDDREREIRQKQRQRCEQSVEEQEQTTAERPGDRRLGAHRSGASASAGGDSVNRRCTNWIETPACSHASDDRRQALGRGVGDRDHDRFGARPGDRVRCKARRPGDPDAVDPPTAQARVVVEKSDDAFVRSLAELAQQAPAASAGTDDQHAALIAAAGDAGDECDERALSEAGGADEQRAEQRVDDEDRGREVAEVARRVDHGVGDHLGDDDGGEHERSVARTRIAPDRAVEPERDEGRGSGPRAGSAA